MRKFLLLSLLVVIFNGAMAQANITVFGPYDAEACRDGYADIISSAFGQVNTVLWEQSTDGGLTWAPIPNNSNYMPFFTYGDSRYSLFIQSTAGMDGYQFRVTFSNAGGSITTPTPAKLFVAQGLPNDPVFVNPVVDVCQGQVVPYTVSGGLKNDSIYWTFGNAVSGGNPGVNDSVMQVNFLNANSTTISAIAQNGCGVSNPTSVAINIHAPQSTLAGTPGGASVCSNYYISWFSATPAADASCNPINAVTASGNNPVAGGIQSCVTVDATVQSYNGIPYVPRHYSLEPAANASTSTATVTLYFTQSDFDAYNAARGSSPALPANPTDAPGIANLHVTQFHGTGTTPNTYVGGSGDINPDDSKIVWNASASRWEVTFDITGFSGFFVSGSPIVPLPLTLTAFTGEETTAGNQLHWTTTMEENTSSFTIQKQTTGTFQDIAQLPAAGNSHQQIQYSYTDAEKGDARYRLKMTDIDGKFSYSRIIALAGNTTGLSIRILPNPSSQPQSLTIGSSSTTSAILIVTDMGGRRLQEKHLTLQKGDNSLDPSIITGLPQGIYLITIATGQQQQTIKFIKE